MKNNPIHNRLLIIVLFYISSLFATKAFSSEPDWQPWSNKTLVQAREEQKLILIDLTADWCVFCKKMEQTTYKDKAVLEELKQHYLAVKADEAEYPELARRFAKLGRPGTIILDSNGKELVSKSGYLKPLWMLWMLQAVEQEISAQTLQQNTQPEALTPGDPKNG